MSWSGKVNRYSRSLVLDAGVFTWNDPKKIARSLKRSAKNRKNKKVSELQSAMSMLNFYINRAGTNLKPARKKILNNAKEELRALYKKN